MEPEKRKLKDDGEANGERTEKARRADDGVESSAAVPGDEEVDEFFAILKRVRLAVQFFRERDGGRHRHSTAWSPAFEREDFRGVETEGRISVPRMPNSGLDLNSHPDPDDDSDKTAQK